MKYCKNCKVNVDTDRDYCPLCFREIKGDDTSDTPLFAERKTNEHINRNTHFLTRLFVFMTICTVAICVIINVMTNQSFSWSLTVISGLTYVWILVAHTIISKRGIFEKVLFQLLAILFILWTSNKISVDHNWLPDYVFPSVSICAVTVLLMIIWIKTDKSWLLSFLTITILLCAASLFVYLRHDTFKLLNLINIIYSGLIILGYFIFGWEAIKQQFSKIFHL